METPDIGSQIIAEVDGGTSGGGVSPEASSEIVGTSGAPASAAPSATTGQPGAGDPDLASIIQKMIEDESGVQPAKKPVVPEQLPEGIDPKGSAAERFQQLANARRESEERAVQAEQQFAQMQQYIGQMQQYVQAQAAQAQQTQHQLMQQIAELRGMQQAALRGPPQPKDPADQLQEQWLSKAQEVFNQTLTPIQQELAATKQAFAEYREQQEVGRLSVQAGDAARQATEQIALKGLPAEMVKELAPSLIGQVLATQLHLNVSPEAAAKIVRQTHMRFGLGLVRANSKALSEAAKRGQGVPAAGSGRRVGSNGVGQQSIEEIRAMGFRDELDPEYMARH